MPPIEVGAPRAIGAVSAEIARRAGTDNAAAVPSGKASAKTAAPGVATSVAVDAGEAPVDTDRVSQIRKAVESGKYPLVPARIADAMIAAGIILRSGHP
ncbi:flagellar biosynthesis anti-sigma factor FlgM [uncultured Novosphingobium sp.]|uniref:flagellar biosynthesis anti-sigma factor FlgM n=1 Tax=Novosphingobium fluoreni TaxID=1391222 RepID=UPI000737475A|nr:flagellar biosynthesis anti-sigma factor FlgM [uncultured Novosphingobium sp.]KTR82261.1 flagellar biosynthesis anti-sigma factor FlgM [Novosphingobium barchaimii]